MNDFYPILSSFLPEYHEPVIHTAIMACMKCGNEFTVSFSEDSEQEAICERCGNHTNFFFLGIVDDEFIEDED